MTTLKLVGGGGGNPKSALPSPTFTTASSRQGAAPAGARLTLPSRVPVEGSMSWLRAWHDDRFRRGALVTVDGRRGWVTAAAAGLVYVRLDSGGRVVARPADISFPS